MLKVSKVNTLIGKDNKNVFVLDYKKDKEEVSMIPKEVHHIQLLDRSGSMHYHIEGLIEDCKKTIEQMGANDYYTIIWFSGEGQYRTVLKGIKNIPENKESSFRVLDSLKSTIGCTCFSESVEETEKIVEELAPLCENFSVTLFTDGEAVTPWPTSAEHARVEKVLERIKDKIISFNTIGYGNYCNETKLNEWASMSDFGIFIHSNDINEYHQIFEENMERIKDVTKDNVLLKIPGAKIYYLTSNSVNIYNEEIKLTHIDKRTNQFIVVYDDTEALIRGEINENAFSEEGNKLADNRLDSILYKLALAEYTFGDRYSALQILGNSLKDKTFSDMLINAFTPDEREQFKRKLKKAAFRNISRDKGSAGMMYIPDENATCLIDLLTLLSSSKENKYVVTENYKRIGRKTEDSFNMFKKDEGIMTSPIENITYNEKKLNISIGFEVKGTVAINPKQAAKVNLPENYPCKIFRNHTIVKDGFLNMDELTVMVNKETLDKLIKDYQFCIHSIEGNGDGSTVTFDLKKIPIVNAAMGKATIEEVFDLVRKENKFKAQLKLAKELTKETVKTYEEKHFTEEQVKLLEEFGIKNGIYNGISTSVPSVADSDYYEARVFEVSLKGFSKLSAIKFNEKNEPVVEKPANGDAYLVEALSHKEDFTTELVLANLKQLLVETRARLAGIRIAKILCGQWFDTSKLADTKKDEVKTYTGTDKVLNKELVMNVKTTYEKVYY